ncbi:hypothetical protein A2818_01265 [Candidatus Nomurabacteria bacterium RIFCSPHIGHO2_01_FULL_40_12]|uniref:Uncharacterized protein n=1 Tax=Candidatus Nomurabacteria bacterium RIFCSPHIGHO2_01_FULL_40_12 TaxID=1801737 RepID=A0A1F6V107_9BACT|nr:MAG: hypothetical protein A2818_01265 [Candidatus Nomurabacteria bacterium RIFCSPHIGHO2_01_FULL_40_12]
MPYLFTKEIIAVIAAVFSIVGNVPYLLDIIKKKIQPHPYTWLVWTIVSGITFFGQLVKGAGIGALPTGIAEIFTIIIFLFSLQYGFKNIKKIDTYFLIFALLGIIPWMLTKDPTFSIIIVVSIDLIAFIPTLRKTWLYPKSEISVLYSMNVLRHILTLFSLQAYNIATVLHSIAMIITNSLMTIFIIFRPKSKDEENT